MKLSHSEIKKTIKQSLGSKLKDNALIILSDGNYKTVRHRKVKSVHHKSGLGAARYRPEVFDCDDFSAVMKAKIAKAAAWNLRIRHPYAFGIVYGNIPTPHAINWLIDNKRRLYFFEPQNGQFFRPGDEAVKDVFFIYT